MVLLMPVILCKIVATYPHFVHSIIHRLIHKQIRFSLLRQKQKRTDGFSVQNHRFFSDTLLIPLHHHQQCAVAAGFALVGPVTEKGLMILISTQAADVDVLLRQARF